jgi:type IV secretory pathway TraG/TraD family ATPase VirD4
MPETTSTSSLRPTSSSLVPPAISPAIRFVSGNLSLLLLFMVCTGLLLWLNKDSLGGKKKRVAKGIWAGSTEKARRRKIGLAQIKTPKRNSYSLYVNSPLEILESSHKKEMLLQLPSRYHAKKKTSGSELLPNAQTSYLVAGRAGCGKSYSVIDRLIISTLEQGFPLCVYDFKYPTQAVYAVLARLYGYKVYFFAPGEPETHFSNLLDFIESPTDSIGATNLAKVISMNCRNPNASEGSDFFDKAGQVIVQASFLLAKWVAEFTGFDHVGDMLTASLIAALPNLAARMKAINSEHSVVSRMNYASSPNGISLFSQQPHIDDAYIGNWVLKSFEQLIGAHGNSEEGEENKTESSIIATALSTFETFVRMALVPAFCSDGSPTEVHRRLPVDIEDKTMYVFGLNRSNRYAVAPLIATLMQSMIDRHIGKSKNKQRGIVVALDELPTLYLPGAVDWPATARSAGVCLISGIQNPSQLASRYGDKDSNTMIGSHGTKILFDPGEVDSAKKFSDMLGDEDIIVNQPTSKSRSSGSTTTSHNRTLQQIAMLAPADFLKLKQGEFILLSSASENQQQSNIPQKMKIEVSPQSLLEEDFCNNKWDVWIETIQKQRPQLSAATIDGMIKDRQALLENLFPEPVASAKDE